VVRVVRASVLAGEHERVLRRPQRPQAVGQLERDGKVTARVTRLERTENHPLAGAADGALSDLDVRLFAIECQVPPLERDQLRAADAGSGEQLEHEPVPRVNERHHELHRL
jgi:hypothetical protein